MSTWYTPGPQATWYGRVEALDDDHWIWHLDWPQLSSEVRVRTNSVPSNAASQWWVLADPDLDMDEGL